MKLTYICGFAWEPKGTVRARAFPLAEEMVRRGHEVTIILVPYDNRAHSGREFTKNGVRIINLEIKNGLAPLARIPYALIKKLDETRPDLVHIFKPKGFAGLAATWLLLRNKPFILDCDDWEGWGGWNETKNYSWPVKEFIDLQEKSLLRRSPAVTVASRTLFDRAKLLRNRNQLFYVPNGPSTEQLERSSRFLREDSNFYKQKFGLRGAPLVLYAGHYDRADDVMFFCRAFARLADRKRANLAFVGDGPELANVRAFFAMHREINALFFGILPGDQYAEVVAASDICAFPFPDTPVYRAKCSVRIVDYMLYGKAVATTSVGENLEYIIDQESGLLTPPGDEAAFSRALARLIADEDLRRRLGTTARARILHYFWWSGSAGDNCESAYHSLIPRKRVEPASLLAS